MYKKIYFIMMILLIATVSCRNGRNNMGLLNGEGNYSNKEIVDINGKIYTEEDIYNFSFHTIKELNPDNYTSHNILSFLQDEFINHTLLYHETVRRKLIVYDSSLDKTLNSLRTDKGAYDLKLSIGSYYTDNNKIIKDLHSRTTIGQLLDTIITNKVVVTDEDIKKYYNTHKELTNLPDRAKVSQIYSKDREKMELALVELSKGLVFSEVAERFSGASESVKGGNLGYIYRNNDMPDIFKSVFKLRVGKYSGILESEYGYHIFYLESYKRGGRQPLNKVKKQIAQHLKEIKNDEAIKEYIDELRSNANIKIIDNFTLINYPLYLKSRDSK